MLCFTWANERKKSWLWVRLVRPGSAPRSQVRSPGPRLVKARKAAFRPPLSAMFSPRVYIIIIIIIIVIIIIILPGLS